MSDLDRENSPLYIAPELLAALRRIAEDQGRSVDEVLNDALSAYVDLGPNSLPRRHVRAAFAASLHEFDDLYRELAK